MVNIGEMFVRLSATATDVKKGADEAVRELGRVEAATLRMNRTMTLGSAQTSAAFNAMRGSMTSLAASALQTAPGVAQLGSVIGSLAFGSVVTVGVLAGLAAITVAWRKLTEDTREAKKATDDAIAALDKLAPKGTEASAILSQVQVARAALSQIELQGARIGALQKAQGKDPFITDVARAETAELLAKNAAAARALQTQIRNGEDEIRRIHAAGWTRLAEEQAQAEQARKAAADRARAAELTAMRAHSEKMAELARRQAAVIAPLTNATTPSVGRLVALGGVTGFGGSAAALTGSGPSAASQGLSLLGAAARQAAEAFSPLALASRVIGASLSTLAPVIETLLMPLTMLGQLVGTLLLPVLRPVAIAFSYVTQGVGIFVEALGKFVDKIVPDWISKVGKDLASFGQKMQDDAKAARDGLNGVAKAANNAADSITNMPQIFDWALRRRQAGSGGMPGSSGGGDGPRTAQPRNAIIVNVNNPPAGMDVDTVTRQITNGVVAGLRRGGTSELSLALRSLSPVTV